VRVKGDKSEREIREGRSFSYWLSGERAWEVKSPREHMAPL
jgi:hypothetical protein